MHISLKTHGGMDIGGVVALVILAMVGLNFVRRHRGMGGDVFHDRAHAVFTISKISFCTNSTVIPIFSTTASFQLKPTVPPRANLLL